MSKETALRWIDAESGEDITDRMNDPLSPPGEGILGVARALGRLMAAQQIEAQRELRLSAGQGLLAGSDETWLLGTPQVGDEVTVSGRRFRYDGSTDDGDHFTRTAGNNCEQALVSLRRGSDEARWMFQQLARSKEQDEAGQRVRPSR